MKKIVKPNANIFYGNFEPIFANKCFKSECIFNFLALTQTNGWILFRKLFRIILELWHRKRYRNSFHSQHSVANYNLRLFRRNFCFAKREFGAFKRQQVYFVSYFFCSVGVLYEL